MDYATWSLVVDGGALGGLDNRGEGPDVLFLHTAGMSALTWGPVMSLLPDLHCVALDLRGHSLSATAPVFDAGDNWRDVRRVVDGLGLRTPVVVGHNTGAFMALAAAADDPDLVRAVIAFELGLPFDSREKVHEELQLAQSESFMDDLCARFGFGQVVASERDAEQAGAARAATRSSDWILAEADDAIAEETRYAFVQQADGTWLHTPDRETLRTLYRIGVDGPYFPNAHMYDLVDVPLHLVQAEGGIITLTCEELEQLRARRPDIHVHAIEGAHLAHRSHADQLAQIIRDVVQSDVVQS